MSSENVSWRLLQRVKIPPFLSQHYFLFIQKDILMKYGVSLCLAVVSKDYYRQMYAVSYLLPHATQWLWYMKASAELARNFPSLGRYLRGKCPAVGSKPSCSVRSKIPFPHSYPDILFHECHGTAITHRPTVRQARSYKL